MIEEQYLFFNLCLCIGILSEYVLHVKQHECKKKKKNNKTHFTLNALRETDKVFFYYLKTKNKKNPSGPAVLTRTSAHMEPSGFQR